ncbi:MAG: hypothetical protein IPL26_28235 [Leptospiraceae bacterium]|nr:hypothetical protein [Leptospiraceae bacterium]
MVSEYFLYNKINDRVCGYVKKEKKEYSYYTPRNYFIALTNSREGFTCNTMYGSVYCFYLVYNSKNELILDSRDISKTQRPWKGWYGSDVIEINQTVKQKSAEPFPTIIGTIDAIHLEISFCFDRNSKVKILRINFLSQDNSYQGQNREGNDQMKQKNETNHEQNISTSEHVETLQCNVSTMITSIKKRLRKGYLNE